MTSPSLHPEHFHFRPRTELVVPAVEVRVTLFVCPACAAAYSHHRIHCNRCGTSRILRPLTLAKSEAARRLAA